MGNRLKELRMASGLTQQAIADKIGTTKGNISKWETGERELMAARGITLHKIADVLGCTIEDLLGADRNESFEYNPEGKLIVDGAWLDPRYPEKPIVQIGEKFFFYNPPYEVTSPRENQFKPIVTGPGTSAVEMTCWCYATYKLEPRRGYKLSPLGGCITPDEMQEIKKKYDLSDDDISRPFNTTLYKFYGKKYEKTIRCIQVRCKTSQGALKLERELREKDIWASNGSLGRCDIRVCDDWEA